MSAVQQLWRGLLSLFFPDRCVVCGKTGALFCETCTLKLRPYPAEAPPEGLDGTTVGWHYDDGIRKAIHRMKYVPAGRRIAEPLGDRLALRLAGAPQPADAIIGVPLHPERMAERGFNQADELALRLGRWSGLPVLTRGLERCRDTGHQAGLNWQERQTNIAGAFVWRGTVPPPARVLLVDDVLTTGATLVACADALRAAGAREVRAVALARSVRK